MYVFVYVCMYVSHLKSYISNVNYNNIPINLSIYIYIWMSFSYLNFSYHSICPSRGHPGDHGEERRHAALRGGPERQQGGGEPAIGGRGRWPKKMMYVYSVCIQTQIHIYMYTYIHIYMYTIIQLYTDVYPIVYLLVMCDIQNGARAPIESSWVFLWKVVIFHSYVNLPEGNGYTYINKFCIWLLARYHPILSGNLFHNHWKWP